MKAIADAPITAYKGEGVQKGTGRFGPFIKWDGLFINVNKKYDFDNLSQSDIETLIEDKLQKNIDKVLHNWTEEGILEKARWDVPLLPKAKLK
jgi:DNA topoisomerase-1